MHTYIIVPPYHFISLLFLTSEKQNKMRQRGYAHDWCNARLCGGQGASLCLSCVQLPSPSSFVAATEGEAAKWVQVTPGITHAGPATVPPRKTPDGATLQITFRVNTDEGSFWHSSGDEPQKLVWWGALPRDLREAAMCASSPAAAYGATEDYNSASKWPNSGTCEVSDDGTVTVQCLAPQSYREEGRRWTRHLHFMRVVGETVDASDVRTVPVWPTHFHGDTYRCEHVEGMSHRGCCIVTREHVASVLDDIEIDPFRQKYWFVDATASGQDIFRAGAADRFCDLDHEEAGDEELRAVGEKIGDDPVVIYCANPKCSAATHLIERLGRLNLCPNFFYMPEGYEQGEDE